MPAQVRVDVVDELGYPSHTEEAFIQSQVRDIQTLHLVTCSHKADDSPSSCSFLLEVQAYL